MSVTIDSVLIQDKELAAADLDGRVVVLSVRGGAYFDFNGVASEIWHLLSEPRSVGELFDTLSQSHEVDATTLSRDVLPTTAHRWVMRQAGTVRALDCTPFNQESESIQWLTGYRVTSLSASINDCTEPNLAGKLAAMEYTHVLVPRNAEDGQWFATHTAPDGLLSVANFDDAQLFAITARTPAVYTAGLTGFFPREHDAERTWRWMGKNGTWTIVNTSPQPVVTTLGIELLAFHRARQMDLVLDGRHVQTLIVDSSRRGIYQIGPLTLMPGGHGLVFHPTEAPTVVSDVIHDAHDVRKRDRRALSFAFGEWNWSVPGGQR